MSNKINPNDPAFPFVEPNAECNVNIGLSIRAELAARAMQALISTTDFCGETPEDVARNAVMYADALIMELNSKE